MNFGVSTESKRILLNATNGQPTYDQFAHKIDNIPLKEILIIYKYLVYSDKKIHHIMYKETADQISENLLKDFIDSDDESKFVVPKPLSENKKQQPFKYNTNDPKVKVADFSQSKKFDPNDFGDQY